jgi:ATP-dependent Lon protease
LEEPKQIGVETKFVVEKQENKSGFTRRDVELQKRRFDSIRKGSTDHETGLRNLVREIRKSMVYRERSSRRQCQCCSRASYRDSNSFPTKDYIVIINYCIV